jgi:1-acyl-sn-glycerol-3-phosphate acyltransferase
LYGCIRWLVEVVVRVLWRPRVLSGDRLPERGPYILAPSHRSILDTFFVAAVVRKRMRFMGKAEIFRRPRLAKFFYALGGFPVERGTTDRAAVRTSVAALEGGEPLVMFPEGTRRSGPLIEDLHDGVAYVAARCRVPIVPVGIGGSEEILARGRKLPKLKRVVLVVGERIDPPSADGPVRRSAVAALTERLRAELQQVFDEAQAVARR